MVIIRILLGCVILSFASIRAADKTNRLVVNVDLGTEKINKNVYGHLAQHLGNCIYAGFVIETLEKEENSHIHQWETI
jgi:hypothetical protein